MIVYLPCKFGEEFTVLKFKEWKDGKKYEENGTATLQGVDLFECHTRSLSIPIIHTNKGFLSYDPQGEFSQDFHPQFKINIELWEKKLCDAGFSGKRMVKLKGLYYRNKGLYVDLMTKDRYEHLLFPIKDNIQYASLNEQAEVIKIEYCKPVRKKIETKNAE